MTDAQIASALAPFGVTPSATLAQQIRNYVGLLLRWNEKINLTRVLEPSEILSRHFGESCFAVQTVPIRRGRLADVGSGAGFPGLAIKLLVPELDVTLLEPSSKRAAFLREVCSVLILNNVAIERTRYEGWVRQGQKLDYIAARAIGKLDRLVRWGFQQLSPGGKMVLWVGGEEAENLTRMVDWHWREPVRIPQSENRFLLIGCARAIET